MFENYFLLALPLGQTAITAVEAIRHGCCILQLVCRATLFFYSFSEGHGNTYYVLPFLFQRKVDG